MSRYLAAVLAAFVAAQPAMAADPFTTGDSYGPRAPHPYTAYSYTGMYLQAQSRPSSFQLAPWVNYASPRGYEDRRQPTVDEQLAASHAHDRRTYDRVVQDGGCNADFIPVYIAEYCNEVAFGNPMGSKGGD